jgi:3-oxoacyl-[acyl-carrier-protein] synthase II
MNNSKVYITGYGVICHAGRNIDACLKNMYLGCRNPKPSALIDSLSAKGYPVFEADAPEIMPDSNVFRTNQLALHAVKQAILDAGYTVSELQSRRVGVVIGTTIGSQLNNEKFYREYRSSEGPDISPFNVYLRNNPARFVSGELKFSGPCQTINNACSSGTDAIMIGASWIRSDVCDLVIAGGADELAKIAFNGFRSLLILDKKPCSPFDKNRQGLNLGEGAGVVILESRPKNKPRGILAGSGFSSDTFHLTAPDPGGKGLKKAICDALSEGGITGEEIAFINTHGTGTKDNDLTEGIVLRDRLPGIPFNSTKCYTGHTLGAAGGIEAAFTLAFLEKGTIPASLGFETVDPQIGICPVSGNTEITGDYAMSFSLAFGGHNSVLLIKKGLS